MIMSTRSPCAGSQAMALALAGRSGTSLLDYRDGLIRLWVEEE